MEKIIKKAIEEGYDAPLNWKLMPSSKEGMVCDPLFWQALGKALEWGESLDCALCEIPEQGWSPKWKKYALKFHEINLTEGWYKAVEYLLNLIEKN